MIRQTKNYLVGALSGVTLIGIAIGAFVVIVSAQVFHEWPIADTGSSAAKVKVAPAKALDSPAGEATAATGIDPALRAKGRTANPKAVNRAPQTRNGDRPATDVSGPASAVDSIPAAGGEEQPSSSGGDTETRSPQPSSPSPSSGGSPGTGTGGDDTATAASSGPSNGASNPSAPATGGGTGGSPTAPSGGGTPVETPVTAVKAPPVAETVNETVHEVDEEALGGTLEKTGVTEATEGVVNGAAGPETPVGKAVEGTTEAVGGLLGG